MRSLRLIAALWLAPMAALAQTAPAPAPASDPKPAPAPASSSSSETEAGDVSEVDKDRVGPLRERIRPVSGHLFLKKGRFEFSPSATVTLRDAFFRKYIFGGTVTYHPAETLGISLRAGYSLPTVSGSAQICRFDNGTDGDVQRGCRSPTFEQLDGSAPGQLTLMGGLDVQWAPIYGKISLLAESFAHFDLYGVGGVSMVQYKGPPENPASSSTSYTAVGGNVGIGLRFFLNRHMTLRTEVRDLIYVEKAVLPATTLRNQLMFELGFSFFFPTALPES
ncbi:outer membrane beta-barrel domain-containing protein [Hyalangium rubrum]|uniref:Outer membrane beta-barrel domain-containing protein n=1 Tax=Hyalangium rubrum TaxID=3103134 RepID=A0ABU5GW24_9BACT|nr:outer membrane beta-barrel domain-containing protein [Hyalangium sp. s54d21]MDY7225380.1 outer membrane beta-barrel domain-containing protein [Hyalangium sp. s54d21]